MASKRRQSETGKTEKRKKKSCEETPQLCSVVADEQVKAAVKEAWKQGTAYTQGGWTNTTFPRLQLNPRPKTSHPDAVFTVVLRSGCSQQIKRDEMIDRVLLTYRFLLWRCYDLCERFFSPLPMRMVFSCDCLFPVCRRCGAGLPSFPSLHHQELPEQQQLRRKPPEWTDGAQLSPEIKWSLQI